MRVWFIMALVFGICCSVFGDGITTVEANGKQYTNVYDVHIGTDGRVVIFSSNGATIASADKLPVDFLKSWNINSEDAKATEARKTADDLERAINSGCFREIDGVVYDTRKPQSGWTNFRKAKVIQVLDDGIILDITPDSSDYFPAHVKNLSSSIGDTDTISFVAKLTGNYSYINKNGDDRTIREYDAGQPCSRDEIPDSVLSGNKTFDVAVQSGSPSRDVVASLPESDDLQANGSGFFITEDGYLITNFHVVKDAKKVKVKNSSGIFPAEVVHVDKDNDLALLKVSGQFKPLHISNDDAELGEAAFTIGFPDIVLQGTDPKYTDGKISSLDGIKDDPKDYQISVQVQPGNSGGPLVDMSGNVIGIIVARLNDMAALSSSGGLPQNVNYAIKSKYLNDFLGQFPEIKLNSIKSTSSEGVVQSTQQSVAMVLVY